VCINMPEDGLSTCSIHVKVTDCIGINMCCVGLNKSCLCSVVAAYIVSCLIDQSQSVCL
jgi:hypothetical protein